MVVRLESLRVTADMDVASYIRASQEKTSADAAMVASAKAVGQTLAATDAAADKAAPAVVRLSKAWITGYGESAKFEKAVRAVGYALDNGMDAARAATQLDGIYRKFGQVADASSLAKAGFVNLAPVVQALNAEYTAMSDKATRAAEAQATLASRTEATRAAAVKAQTFQGALNAALNVEQAPATTNGAGSEAIEAKYRKLEQDAQRYLAALDPLSAAEARHNANLSEGARLVKEGEISTRQYALASANSAKELDKVREAVTGAGKAEADQIATRDRLLRSYDILGSAERVHQKNLEDASRLLAAGALKQHEYDTVVTQSRRVLEDTTKAFNGAYTAQSKFATGSGLARHELINFSRQAQDVFVSLASGQGVMTVLIQQGTQIGDIFAASRGSFSGFLGQAAAGIASLGPLIPIIVGVTAAVGALYAALTVSSEKTDLSRSLLGTGRASNLTGGQLDDLAKASAAAADITVSSARLIAAEFVQLGAAASANLPRATQLTKAYAIVTQQDLTQSAKDLSQALADPAKTSEMLSGKIGALDASVQAAIRTALSYNDVLRAQKYAMEGIAQATEGAIESQSKWERLKAGAGRLGNAIVQGVAEAVVPDTASAARQKEYNELLAERAQLEKSVTGIASQGRTQRLADIDAQINALRPQIEGEKELASLRQKNFKQTQDIGKAATEAATVVSGETVESMMLKTAKLDAGIQAAKAKLKDLTVSPDVNQDASAGLTTEINQLELALRRAQTVEKDLRLLRTDGKKDTDLEADKLQRELDIKAQFAGKNAAADQAELARLLDLNRQRGTLASSDERNRNAALKAKEVYGTGNEQRATSTRIAEETVRDLGAVSDAYKQAGVSAGELKKIEAQAARETKNTGEDTPEGRKLRVMELLMERRSQEVALIEEGNAKQRDGIAITQRVISDAKVRETSEAEISRQLDIQTKQKELESRLRSAGVPEAEIIQRVQELTTARTKELDVEKQRIALGILYGQNEQIAGLQLEIDLVGKSAAARREAIAVLRAEQEIKRQGIATDSDEARLIRQRAVDVAKLNNKLDDTRRAYEQVRAAQEFVADSFKSFAEELLTGTDGINGALKSLGKSFLSSSLDALISGKGALAGITGLASQDKDKQGGILGLLTGNNLVSISKAVETGAKKGSEAGTTTGIGSLASGDGFNLLGGLGVDGKQLAGGLTAIAGLAGAYGAGMSAKSQGMGIAGGAISGAVAGAAFGPIGVALGAVIGGALGGLGQSSAAKKAKEAREAEAQANYKQAQPDIAKLGSQLRGEAQGTLAQNLADAKSSALKLGDVAFFAGKVDEQHKLYADYLTYEAKTLNQFRNAYAGALDALSSGLGPDSPFGRSREAVKSLGDQLKVFIDDTKTAFGDGAPEIERSKQAARDYALQVLDGSKELSTVGTRMEEIRGISAGLKTVLVDLGMSAQDAADAIDQRARAALDRLKTSFETDLKRKTNDASGSGYLNEISDLIKEVSSLRADASALGTDQGLVTSYFSAKAQEIVNGADLTGQAFSDLLTKFPDLIGSVREAGVTINETARLIEAASRRLSYQDRLFAATNDSTTLTGQLAAFDRQAERDRAAEVKAGGDAINDLEMALSAERLKIIVDFADQAVAEQKRALEDAQNFFDTFSKNLKQFVDGLRTGSDSPLSPQAKLAAAQSQYNAQLALAQGGNRDAVNSLTTYATALLDSAKGYYASSAGYQSVFNQIQAQLTALPTQVSAEQFIVNAIDASKAATVAKLESIFTEIDVNGDGFISRQEAANTFLNSIFSELDTNGDGQLSKLELIRGATLGTQIATTGVQASNDYSNALLVQTQNIIAASNNLLYSANAISASQESLLAQIRALNDVQRQTLQALQGQFGYNNQVGINGLVLNNNMVEALNKIVFNTASTVLGQKAGAPYAYAEGGWITGGTPGVDSVPLASGGLGMPGEFVVSKAVAQANAAWLPRFNATGRIPALVPTGTPANGNSAAAEIRALRMEVRELRAALVGATVASAEHIREGIDQGVSAQQEAAREFKAGRRTA